MRKTGVSITRQEQSAKGKERRAKGKEQICDLPFALCSLLFAYLPPARCRCVCGRQSHFLTSFELRVSSYPIQSGDLVRIQIMAGGDSGNRVALACTNLR